jgi:hypothetical protein
MGGVLAVVVGVATVTGPAAVAGSSGSLGIADFAGRSSPQSGGTCFGTATGHVNYAAGGPSTARRIDGSFEAHYRCRMSDPTIQSVIESGSSTGALTCSTLSGYEAGTDRWTWSNGRSSTLTYYDAVNHGISHVTGRFVRGEFKGLSLNFVGLVGGNAVSFCTSSTAGSTPLVYVGGGPIGSGG